MAGFTKLQVLDAIIRTGMMPVYYNKNAEIAKKFLWLVMPAASVLSNLRPRRFCSGNI